MRGVRFGDRLKAHLLIGSNVAESMTITDSAAARYKGFAIASDYFNTTVAVAAVAKHRPAISETVTTLATVLPLYKARPSVVESIAIIDAITASIVRQSIMAMMFMCGD